MTNLDLLTCDNVKNHPEHSYNSSDAFRLYGINTDPKTKELKLQCITCKRFQKLSFVALKKEEVEE